jgi:hypothetical protein
MMAEDRQLIATVGAPASPDGQTRVTLSGTGALLVQWIRRLDERDEQKRPGKPEQREEKGEIGLDPAPLFERTNRFPWGQRFPNRPGVPDEAIVEWDVSDQGERRQVRVWINDAEDDPAMGPVLTALRDGTARLTGGEIYL